MTPSPSRDRVPRKIGTGYGQVSGYRWYSRFGRGAQMQTDVRVTLGGPGTDRDVSGVDRGV